jgi:hypothetical protein
LEKQLGILDVIFFFNTMDAAANVVVVSAATSEPGLFFNLVNYSGRAHVFWSLPAMVVCNVHANYCRGLEP